MYDQDLKRKRDNAAAQEYSRQTGIEEGENKRTLAIAQKFKSMGLPINEIAEGTGLTIEEIRKLPS